MTAPAAPVARWEPDWATPLTDHVGVLAWAPGGAWLAAGSLGGDVLVLDAITGRSVPDTPRHPGGVLSLGWCGTTLVTGGQDGSVTVGGERRRLGGWVNAIAVSTHGRVAFAHGRSVSLDDGRVIAEHTSTVTALTWHPTGDTVAAASFGRLAWERPDGGARDVSLVWGGAIESVHVSADGRWGAAGVRGDYGYVWRIDADAPAQALPVGRSDGRLVGFSADGALVGLGTPTMTAVFDLGDLDPLGAPSGQWLTSVGRPTALAWHPVRDLLCTAVTIGTGPDDNGLLAWEPRRSPRPVLFVGVTAPVTTLAWSPDGARLAVATADGAVTVAADPFAS